MQFNPSKSRGVKNNQKTAKPRLIDQTELNGRLTGLTGLVCGRVFLENTLFSQVYIMQLMRLELII